MVTAQQLFLRRCFLWMFAFTIIAMPEMLIAQHDFSDNSTAKKRIKPSAVASRIGTAVQWRENVDAALKESAQTGKPVFWYVPTVKGTFMDRKDSIDRYMLAGPFSWPYIIELLNENFVPVRSAPKSAHQQKYDLKPYVFIEPGFMILMGNGESLAKVDRLTTLHPQWLHQLIASYSGNLPRKPRSELLNGLWSQFSEGDYQNMVFPVGEPSADQLELMLLEGMTQFRLGNHTEAKRKWEQASQLDPESPLAWKAAAEAEGFGPFVRGFEVHRKLTAAALDAGRKSSGSAAPQAVYDEPALWKCGIEFLLGMQSENGGWLDSDYDFGGTDSLPNVHAAVSAIAGMALLESQMRAELDPALEARVDAAIERVTSYLIDNKNLNQADRDELVWAYAYRIRFLSRLIKDKPELLNSLAVSVKDLESIQAPSGSWFHEYPNPMVTALALLAFAESAEAGVSAQSETISRGIGALGRDRYGNGGFTYSSSRGNSQPKPGGDAELAQSAGRMPICELALWLHDASSMERLNKAIERSFELSEPMMNALKYDDHTSNYAYGGFFIWYDIESRGEAILKITDADLKSRFQQSQRDLILSLPEVDGCFVDSHELGRVYGTAMGLLSLAKTRR